MAQLPGWQRVVQGVCIVCAVLEAPTVLLLAVAAWEDPGRCLTALQTNGCLLAVAGALAATLHFGAGKDEEGVSQEDGAVKPGPGTVV